MPLVRSYSEEGWSNPKKILDRVMHNIEECKLGILSYETLLNSIMNYLEEEQLLDRNNKPQLRNAWNTLTSICEEDMCISLDTNIDNIELKGTAIISKFNEKQTIEIMISDMSKIINRAKITYEEGFDKICIIVDRDRKSFIGKEGNNQYEYVLKKCREKDYGFYITNPCFEFWLLLHFDDVKNLDRQNLLLNPKINRNTSYAESELKKLMPMYKKENYQAEILVRDIDKAIENEKKYCEDEELLETNIGSNIGLLIGEMTKM